MILFNTTYNSIQMTNRMFCRTKNRHHHYNDTEHNRNHKHYNQNNKSKGTLCCSRTQCTLGFFYLLLVELLHLINGTLKFFINRLCHLIQILHTIDFKIINSLFGVRHTLAKGRICRFEFIKCFGLIFLHTFLGYNLNILIHTACGFFDIRSKLFQIIIIKCCRISRQLIL